MKSSCKIPVVLSLGLMMTAETLVAQPPVALAPETAQMAAWQETIIEHQLELEDRAERLRLATAIMDERESLGDRELDASWKARRVRDLAKRTQEELQTMLADVEAGLAIDFPKALGDSAADLVFTPLATPCRFYDSRVDLFPGPFLAGDTFNFYVAGTFPGGPSGQGASSSCGVPFGPATAVVVNVLAVDTGGKGNWQVWPFGGAPGDSVINFAANSALDINLINGVMIPICDPSVSTCDLGDLTARLNFAAFSDFVINVTGYFSRVPTDEIKVVTERSVSGATVPLTIFCGNYLSVTVNAPGAGTVEVNANAWLRLEHSLGVTDYAIEKIGESATDCNYEPGNSMTHLIPPGNPTGALFVTVPTRSVFTVGAGTQTYYLNGYMFNGASAFDSFLAADITARFFPD